MESVRVKDMIRRFSFREVCYVCLCIIIFYLFRVRDSYYLIPTWRKRIEAHNFENGKFPTAEDTLPTPLVTDLESDGINEVVMVTADGKLSVLALPEQQKMADGSLPHVVVKHEVELQLTRPGERFARPVVLDAGFTTPYLSMMQIRKQIIVIVTDDWHVLCFEPDLTLLWEVTLPLTVNLLEDIYSVKSLGVLITSHSVMKNSGGLIIIGGNFMHKTHHTKELPVEKLDEQGSRVVEMQNVVEEVENLTHFSTFALSAMNGTIRWHHLPGDFGQQTHNIKDHSTEHHWKLGLRKDRRHSGEAPWKMYSKELSNYMPHMWVNNQHTKFTLGRFAKDTKTGSNADDHDEDEKGDTTPALSPHHIVGYAYGGQRPHSESEHATNPNAVVIRGPHGIEVLSLLSGQPITHLEFPRNNDMHFDVDGDGELEDLVWDLGKGHTVCYLDIWRTFPLKEKLEQLAMCISQRLIWQHSWSLEEDVFKRMPPMLIKSVAKKGGLFRHLLGQHLTEREEYDLINFGAVGRMSSFDLSGNVHWQICSNPVKYSVFDHAANIITKFSCHVVLSTRDDESPWDQVQTSSKWSDLSIKLRRKSINRVPKDIEDEFIQSFSPGFILMPLEVSDRKDVAAIAGYNTVSLVDLVDGTLLAEHSIPSVPSQPLAYGDFDNDGIHDIILTCKKGFIGFTVKMKANYEYSILYASAVLLTILFVTWLLTQPSEVPDK